MSEVWAATQTANAGIDQLEVFAPLFPLVPLIIFTMINYKRPKSKKIKGWGWLVLFFIMAIAHFLMGGYQ